MHQFIYLLSNQLETESFFPSEKIISEQSEVIILTIKTYPFAGCHIYQIKYL